jgi:hypothetical protein
VWKAGSLDLEGTRHSLRTGGLKWLRGEEDDEEEVRVKISRGKANTR